MEILPRKSWRPYVAGLQHLGGIPKPGNHGLHKQQLGLRAPVMKLAAPGERGKLGSEGRLGGGVRVLGPA